MQKEPRVNPLDYYVKEAPTDQNVLDIFQGHWSSAMPQHTGLVSQPGPAALFEDDRLTWAEQELGGFSGQRILELGPLEGAHSYICQQKGAAEVVAVEANSQSFLRCLCIKEIFKLDRVTFKLGDLNMYLRSGAPHYDIVLACGVLYHMVDPLLTLRLIAEVSDRLFLWTHYYDADIIGADRAQAATFEQSETRSFRGHEFKLAKKRYESALNWDGFCGGAAPFAYWLDRSSLLMLLESLGYDRLTIGFDHPSHPHGPSLAVCAVRTTDPKSFQ